MAPAPIHEAASAPKPNILVLPNDVVEFSTAGTGLVQLHNISEEPVAFRVLFTSPGMLDCQPAEGMVPPGKHIEAVLTTLKPKAPNNLPHRIVVRTATVHVGAKRSEIWVPEAVQEHLRTCEREARAEKAPGASDVGIVSGARRNAYGTEARLRAAERLVLTRSAQLAASEHRLAAAQSGADAFTAPLPTRPPPAPPMDAECSPPPRPRWHPLVSHLCIGLLALAIGVAWAQQDAAEARGVQQQQRGVGAAGFWPAGWPSLGPLAHG